MIAQQQAALAFVVAAFTLLVAAMGGAPRWRRRPARVVPAVVRAGLRVPAPAVLCRLTRQRVRPAALITAGWEGIISPDDLARAQSGLACAGAVAGLATVVVSPGLAVAVPLLGMLGWLLPARVVLTTGRARAERIRGQLPDMLDLLALCVGAGMAVDPALEAAATRLRGPLGAELEATLRDVRLGSTRRTAYEDLARRVPIPEVAQVVAAMLQADELGAPLSRALGDQAEALREERRRRARERAAKAAPAIQLVVAMVMVPAALILVVAVMVLELMRQVGPVFGGLG